jgi:hypothetical protein
MATKNQWLTTNIRDRLTDPSTVFSVSYNVSDVIHEGFLKESLKARDYIVNSYNKIYVSLSGGMDSEFVMDCFGESAIPIIVETPGNKLESSYAFHYCKRNNITPVVIKKTEAEILEIFYKQIIKKINGVASDSVATYIATKYAVDNGGIAVIGEHAYDYVIEWDFYNDALIDINSSLYFFMWTPELVKAMKDEWEKFDDHQEFKHSIYNIPFRPKLKYNYSLQYQQILNKLLSNKVYPTSKKIYINI